MESFNFISVVPDEGRTFIFGSWVYIANCRGGFNIHPADTGKLKASTLASHHDIGEPAADLGETQLFNLLDKIAMDEGANIGQKATLASSMDIFFDMMVIHNLHVEIVELEFGLCFQFNRRVQTRSGVGDVSFPLQKAASL
jgi:hypothetical protein